MLDNVVEINGLPLAVSSVNEIQPQTPPWHGLSGSRIGAITMQRMKYGERRIRSNSQKKSLEAVGARRVGGSTRAWRRRKGPAPIMDERVRGYTEETTEPSVRRWRRMAIKVGDKVPGRVFCTARYSRYMQKIGRRKRRSWLRNLPRSVQDSRITVRLHQPARSHYHWRIMRVTVSSRALHTIIFVM